MNNVSRALAKLTLSTTLLAWAFAGCGGDDSGKTPPHVPTITEPAEGAVVASPITVSGTAEALADIEATIWLDDTKLGVATSTADTNGNYTLSLPYTNQTDGVDLSIQVIQHTDAGSSEAATVTVVQGIPPQAPSVTSPSANEEIDSPVTVTGTGEAGLTVLAKVMQDATSLGEATVTVDSDGSFSVPVTYTNATPDTELTVRVTQSNGFGTSTPTDVAVRQFAVSLSGTISQSAGEPNGAVYLRLYNSATEVVSHLQEITIADTPGLLLPSTDYTFVVGRGTYYVRAFRDAKGPNHSDPDEQPTLPLDPQAVMSDAAVVEDNDDTTGPDVDLVDVSSASFYRDFNTFAYNQSARDWPPQHETSPGSGEYVSGGGSCGGFFMFAEAALDGGGSILSDLSAPSIVHPSGSRVTMLDDGGCGWPVGDNTDSSYDNQPDDNRFSYGWLNPDENALGDYIFFYRNVTLDVIHMQVDTINAITKLSRRIPLTSPTGETQATTSTTFSWDAISDALSYQLWISALDGGYYGSTNTVTSTSNVPLTSSPLDDHAYRVVIDAYDADISAPNTDYDARSNSIASYFVIDDAGDNIVTISGSVTNNTDSNAPIYVAAFDEHGPNGSVGASVFLSESATSYTLTTLASSSSDGTRLEAFLDADFSGDAESEENQAYRVGYQERDGSANLTQPVIFNMPITLSSLEDGASQVGITPLFSWQDYSAHAPSGAWTYGFFVQSANSNNLPDVIWALPNTVTSFDFANPPLVTAGYDVVAYASCLMTGGTYNSQTGPGTATCTGGTPTTNLQDLSSATDWSWGVVVIECDLNDYFNNVDLNTNNIDDFSDCLAPVLMGGSTYAQSMNRSFSTN